MRTQLHCEHIILDLPVSRAVALMSYWLRSAQMK
jgi:hypothetical protein